MRDAISREYFSEANTYRIKVFTDSYHIYETLKYTIEKYCSETERPQLTGKLNNPDDSLLTADSEACKEQKSKLDLISRADMRGEDE